MTVAVVGAGLAGLSAAWDLCQAGAEVVVLDAARQPGGMIVTERRDGFVVEGGPDGFLAAEPDLQELAREVGIGERLVDQVARGSALWTGRGLEALADGKAAELLGIQVNGNVGGFRSFAAGMAEVVEALVACLVPRLRTTQGVTAVVRAGGARGWRLSFTGGSALEAEALILAVPAWVAARQQRLSSSRFRPGWPRACSPASACRRLARSIPCSTRRASPCRSPTVRTRCRKRSRGRASLWRWIRGPRCGLARTRGGSTRSERRKATPCCARSWDRWTAIRPRSRTPSSPLFWVSRGIRSGPARSTGRGGCHATRAGTASVWQPSATGLPGSLHSRSRGPGSMARGYRRV